MFADVTHRLLNIFFPADHLSAHMIVATLLSVTSYSKMTNTDIIVILSFVTFFFRKCSRKRDQKSLKLEKKRLNT